MRHKYRLVCVKLTVTCFSINVLILSIIPFFTSTPTPWRTVGVVAENASDVISFQPWWKHVIVYQIYQRSFKDSNGDGNGDMKGIIEKLDYLKEIGIGAIWICTIFKSPMVGFGYDVTDYKDIDPIFGSLQDFSLLIKKAHALNFKVIIDLIPNHTSEKHFWFVDSSFSKDGKYEDYYVWKDGIWNSSAGKYDPPTNWDTFGSSAWEWSNDRKQFYFHSFVKEMPDLNLRNEKVVQELMEIVRFWIDFGVDGFRVDGVEYLYESVTLRNAPPNPAYNLELPNNLNNVQFLRIYQDSLPENFEFLTTLARTCQDAALKMGKEILIVTEAYGLEYKEKYYKTGISFPFNLMLTDWKAQMSSKELGALIDGWLSGLEKNHWPNWVLSNHDVRRISMRLGSRYSSLANALLLLLPGTPFVYFGDEIGMAEEDIQDGSRTPMQWSSETPFSGFSKPTSKAPWMPLNPDFAKVNVEVQLQDSNSVLNHFKFLTKLRAAESSFSAIDSPYEFIDVNNDNIFAFVRGGKGYAYFAVILNIGPQTELFSMKQLPLRIGQKFKRISQSYNFSSSFNSEPFLHRKTTVFTIDAGHWIILKAALV